MDPEDIVRAFAARDWIDPQSWPDGTDREVCLICGANAPYGHDVEHVPDCLWRLSREWVSNHPGGGMNPPFNPQYDLIGDAEQPQGPKE